MLETEWGVSRRGVGETGVRSDGRAGVEPTRYHYASI